MTRQLYIVSISLVKLKQWLKYLREKKKKYYIIIRTLKLK